MFKLSPRLQTIYDALLVGNPVWDFCCDHGYLGLAAHASRQFPQVHFVDQVPHILTKIQERLGWTAEHHLPGAYFHARAGQSLETEVRGTVAIAGVGGFTIFKIIDGLLERDLLHAERLILAPQKNPEKILDLLMRHSIFCEHYKLEREAEILEGRRVRKILIFGRK